MARNKGDIGVGHEELETKRAVKTQATQTPRVISV